MRRFYPRVFILLFAAAGLLHSTADACTVPVFRYALERWQPVPYDILVFHRGTLTKAQTTAANSILAVSPPGNLQIEELDLDASNVDEDALAVWKANPGTQLPWIAVQVAGPDNRMHVLWSGPLDSSEFKQLVDSPLRRTIGRHLLAGESAVWVLIEGGNATRDEGAYRLLETRLRKIESETETPRLPPAGSPGNNNVLTDLPLKLKFDIERLSRDDAAETVFLRMLLFADKKLLESNDPIIVPVFGRGRALGCLTGKNISADGITELGMFLGGQCSCEVKEQNPGYDLLMAVAWDSIFREHPAPPQPAAKPTAVVASDPPFVAGASLAMVKAAQAPTPVVAVPSRVPVAAVEPWRRTALVAATVVVAFLVVVLGWFTFRPRRSSTPR